MILLDYSAICISSAFSSTDTSYEVFRAGVLTRIAKYNSTYSKQFGELVICCDADSWRKTVFPQYKSTRTEKKAADRKKWEQVYDNMDRLLTELRTYFSFKIVKVSGAEADDIIGTLTQLASIGGEEVMIISSDKDFVQLQKYKGVKQFSPYHEKELVEPKPTSFLITQILKGDSGDGIPNIMSDDDAISNKSKRQTPLKTKLIEACLAETQKMNGSLTNIFTPSMISNFRRNALLIDLNNTPVPIKESIVKALGEKSLVTPETSIAFLISKGLAIHVQHIENFIPKTNN